MIAVFIMGLLSSVVVLAMTDGQEALEREAERLAARLQMAAQESLMSGEAWGLDLTPDGYGFMRRRVGVWTRIGARDRFFHRQDWDDDTVASWRREGAATRSERLAEIEAAEEDARDEDAPNPFLLRPVAQLDPTGEMTPLEITLERGDTRFLIRTSAEGEVSLVRLP